MKICASIHHYYAYSVIVFQSHHLFTIVSIKNNVSLFRQTPRVKITINIAAKDEERKSLAINIHSTDTLK